MQPTGRTVHIDSLLSEILIAYQNVEYVADNIAPILPVRKQSNILPKYNQSAWFRDEARIRPPATEPVTGGFTVDTSDTYFCQSVDYAFDVPWEWLENQDEPFDLERDGTEFVADKLLLRREVNFGANFFTNTGVWGTDKVGGTDFTKWDLYGSSAPLVDITGWFDDVQLKIGRDPKKAVMGRPVWSKLKWHPDVIDTIKHTQRAQMTRDIFASLIEVESLDVGSAIYTTSPEGTAEASVTYTRAFGKHFLLTYMPPRPSLLQPAAMYTVVWNGLPWAPGLKGTIQRMELTRTRATRLWGASYWQQKMVGARAGLFAQNAVN